MKQRRHAQSGMTLVEVVLVLAISSLLLTSILAGRNSIRSTAEFSDGMERIKEMVLDAKNQANNSVSDTSNGANASYVAVGKIMQFSKGSNTVKTATVLCKVSGPSDDCDGNHNIQFANDVKSMSLPWGIMYGGSAAPASTASGTLLFMRSGDTGSFTGYWNTNGGANVIQTGLILGTTTPSSATKLSRYQQSATAPPLAFTGAAGQLGYVKIDPAAGTVVREIP